MFYVCICAHVRVTCVCVTCVELGLLLGCCGRLWRALWLKDLVGDEVLRVSLQNTRQEMSTGEASAKGEELVQHAFKVVYCQVCSITWSRCTVKYMRQRKSHLMRSRKKKNAQSRDNKYEQNKL